MICGIDPGVNGAVAILEDSSIISVFDIPVFFKSNGKKEIDAPRLYELLLNYKLEKAVVEKVHSMPGQGVSSVFGFGESLGIIKGVLAGSEIDLQLVTPQEWKKYHNLIGTKKDTARLKVIDKYQDHKDTFRRKKDVDRADAVLIGLFGCKKKIDML